MLDLTCLSNPPGIVLLLCILVTFQPQQSIVYVIKNISWIYHHTGCIKKYEESRKIHTEHVDTTGNVKAKLFHESVGWWCLG